MYTNELRSRIEIEQRKQQNSLLFTLLVTLFSVISSAVAPQLIYEYLLQGASVDQQMLVLQYFPIVFYVIPLVAFVMATVGFMNYRRKLRMYEQEILMLQYTEDDCDCEDPEHDHNHTHEVVTVPAEASVQDLSQALAKTNSTARKAAPRKRGRAAGKKSSK